MGSTNVITRFSDKRFSLASGYLTRELDIVGEWSRIRIGILVQLNGAATIPGISFFLGLCSGINDGYGGIVHPVHAVGAAVGPTTGTTWTFSGITFTGLSLFAHTNVNGTRAFGGVNLAAPVIYDTTSLVRSLMFLDITKGTPNYTFQMFSRTAAGVDATETDFVTQMQAAVPAFAGHATAASQVLAVNETTNGNLDCFNIQWGHSQSPLEISALGVYVVAASVAFDDLESYALGSITGAQMNGGKGWVASSSITDNFIASVALDTLETYSTGTITGAGINAGTGWDGASDLV